MRELKVVTHGETAHIDELLAIAVMAEAEQAEVVTVSRINHITEDMCADPSLKFVDVGGKYDGIRFFDHHQTEEAVEGHCAASLVVKDLLPELLEDDFFKTYLKRVTIQDTQGLKAASEHFIAGQPAGPFLATEWGLVKIFEQTPAVAVAVMRAIIADKLNHIRETKQAEAWLAEHASIEVLPCEVSVLVLDEDPRIAGIGTQAINAAQNKFIKAAKATVHASYAFDPRQPAGTARKLFRMQGAENILDFNKATPQNLLFKHKAGFQINFVPAGIKEYQQLLEQAKL